MERNNLIKDLIAVWISLAALVCAALNIFVSGKLRKSKKS